MSAANGGSGGFFDASATGISADGGGGADYVIVGSGAGGGAVARELSAAGRSVIVLEEGPLAEKDTLSPVARIAMERLYRNGGQQAAFGRAAVPVLQARCVGGTTFVNSAIIWRLPEKILHRWHTEFGLADALPAAALDEAYTRIEEEMHVRPVADLVASRADVLMKIGAEHAGIENRAIRRSERECRGSARCFHGCPTEAKQSTAVNYLRRAVDGGASVYANAGATRIVVEGGRAVAVVGRITGQGGHAKQAFRVQARKAVIVCASVVQSPNLLRRSGLGLDGDALGNHFTAHPGTALPALYADRVNPWTGASQGFEAYGLRDTLGVKLETINIPPEVAAARMPGAGPRLAAWIEKLPYLAFWATAVRADSEGTVRPSWLLGGDVVDYTLRADDIRRLRDGLKRMAEMHFLAGALEVLPGIIGMPETLTSPDQLGLFDQASLDPRAYNVIATHLFGTCRSGPDPRHSVVDPSLRVHGVERLYVMDASIFPTNTGVNPQHSIMAIATVAARRLASA